MRVHSDGGDFLDLLKTDPEVMAALDAKKLTELFNATTYTTHVDTIFKRVFGRC